MGNLTHGAHTNHSALLKIGGCMRDFMLEDLSEATAALAIYAGGHPKKNKNWKDGLDQDCSKEVLKERFNSVLSHAKGVDIKTKGSDLQLVLTRLEAHVELVRELNATEGEHMSTFVNTAVCRGKDLYAQSQASKLEYWVCHYYFSGKEKIDKRDQVQHYANQFDALQIVGGREQWVHKCVCSLEAEMKAYAGGKQTGDAQTIAEAASSAGSPRKKRRKGN